MTVETSHIDRFERIHASILDEAHPIDPAADLAGRTRKLRTEILQGLEDLGRRLCHTQRS